MPQIELDGRRLFYEDRGHGPAVLLIHSFPHDHRVWDDQADALADQYRIITPDLPGFGQSQRVEKFSVELAADLLLQLITKLDLPRVVIGGISMGGYITLAIAKLKPPQLAGLILADTKAAADTPEAKQRRSDLIELVRNGGAAHVVGQMLPTQLADDVAADRPHALHHLRNIMEAQSPDALIAGTRTLRDRPDLTAVLPTIDVPVLLLFGQNDTITPPSIADRLAELLKRSITRIIPDAGHISTIDQPQRVTDALREFLPTAV